MKRYTTLVSLLLTAAVALSACGDSSSSEASQSAAETAETTTTATAADPEAEPASEDPAESEAEPEKPAVESCRIEDENFDIYVSNSFFATGNNGLVDADETTFRCYLPLEEYGELEYRFFFSNTVDSTYSYGKPVYVGREGGEYTVSSAYIYTGTDPDTDQPGEKTQVLFDGSGTKAVSAGECYWSDPVTFSAEEGEFLVWEWTLTGKDIPATNISELSFARMNQPDGELVYTGSCPLPVLVGAKRGSVQHRLVFLGDSITQGVGTDTMASEYWVAKISQQLPQSVSVWNCGLGWARASDAATAGPWLGRALNCDTLVVAFGSNDLSAGEFGRKGRNNGNSADELLAYMETLLDQCVAAELKNIIVFNSPPFEFNDKAEAERTDYNERLKTLCEEKGVSYFDFSSLLEDPSNPSHALYGGHPNAEGCDVAAAAFLEEYGSLFS